MSYEAKNFPPLKNDNILRAARGESVDRIPVWVMRQAGRYLPEFLEVRKEHDFLTVCDTPKLACEVTMQPLRRFDLDASIIFSDILLIPRALGMTVEFTTGKGPSLSPALEGPANLLNLKVEGAIDHFKSVGDAITMMRHLLDGKVPLIGFSGAPWTLMAYMVEGHTSKTFSSAKEWFTRYPEETHKLLQLLTDITVDYLKMQIKAGAQMLQIFESGAQYISKDEFAKVSLPYVKQIRDRLRKELEAEGIEPVPMVIFAKGAGHSLKEQAQLGYEVIGIDWTVDPERAREIVGPNVTLQGNLNPDDMLRPPAEIKLLVKKMIKQFGRHRYIANLGHGITPPTPIESMEVLVETVHSV